MINEEENQNVSKEALKEQLKDVLFKDQLDEFDYEELNYLVLTDEEIKTFPLWEDVIRSYRKLTNELIRNIYRCNIIMEVINSELLDFVQLLLDAKIPEWMGVDLTDIKPKEDGTYNYDDLKKLNDEIFAKYSEAWDKEESEDGKQTEV